MATTFVALTALIVALVALIVAARVRATAPAVPPARPPPPPATGGAGKMKLLAPTFLYNAGVAGTYTVPANNYVTGVTCHATGAATLSINGGDPIPIPAGAAFSMCEPLIGTNNQLPGGSTLVFTGTDSYVVLLG